MLSPPTSAELTPAGVALALAATFGRRRFEGRSVASEALGSSTGSERVSNGTDCVIRQECIDEGLVHELGEDGAGAGRARDGDNVGIVRDGGKEDIVTGRQLPCPTMFTVCPLAPGCRCASKGKILDMARVPTAATTRGRKEKHGSEPTRNGLSLRSRRPTHAP